jgi:hypothetical protein
MPLTSQDLVYLLALNASEESSLLQLKWDLMARDCNFVAARAALRTLQGENFLRLVSTDGGTEQPVDTTEFEQLIAAWPEVSSATIEFRLTDVGLIRWKSDDWGISRGRAQYLMFEQVPGTRVVANND